MSKKVGYIDMKEFIKHMMDEQMRYIDDLIQITDHNGPVKSARSIRRKEERKLKKQKKFKPKKL